MENDSSLGSPRPCRRPPAGAGELGPRPVAGPDPSSKRVWAAHSPPGQELLCFVLGTEATSLIRGASAQQSMKHISTHSGFVSSAGLRAVPVPRDLGVRGRSCGCSPGPPGASAASAVVRGSCQSGKTRAHLPPLWGTSLCLPQSGPLGRFTRLGQCCLPPPPQHTRPGRYSCFLRGGFFGE